MLGDEDEDFDYGSIKDILQKDSNAFLKGVKNTDVDWFLRDTGMNPPKDSSHMEDTSPGKDKEPDSSLEHKGSANHVPEANTLRRGSLEPNSHLQTSISNTNDHILSKTRPSVATIHEEGSPTLTSYRRQSQNCVPASSTSRRGSNASAGSIGSAASSKSGRLFSKLKGKFSSVNKEVLPPASPTSSLPSIPSTTGSVFKENYSLSAKGPKTNTEPAKSEQASLPPRSTSSADDPRLEEYIKFYKQDRLRSSSCCVGKLDCPAGSGHLHSALVNGNEASPVNMNAFKQAIPQEQPNTAGRLSSFLRRKSSISSVPTDRARRSSETSMSIASASPSPSVHQRSIVTQPEFAGLKPLKSVAFHSLTFLMDPPQQIPSRNPRKGNVELLPNGSYRINPLTDEDKAAIEKSLMGRGGGIVVGGSGALNIKKPNPDAEGASITQNNSAQDVGIDQHAKQLGVEKPMVSHLQHRYQLPVEKMALDIMYTRCCHLREILPIPAIMKQIPKGSMAPIPILQMKNPTPTMVEVLTFADFIRIAPIICVSLDGVSLSLEQFKILLSAMSAKTQLEKLSLRNTPIDYEGWLLFCWFLSRNKLLNKLDITQCPSLSVNVVKKNKRKSSSADSKTKKEPETKRMECNKENRSDMDWSLFTATITARGGIEEIILTGCCITDFDVFEKFIKLAVLIKTNRLGLAYNNLTAKQLRVVVDFWLFKKFVRGLDLGYNDLLSLTRLNIFLEQQRKPGFERRVAESLLTFLSLNATNLRFSDTFKETLESVLMKLPNLKYLDLSNNARLFGRHLRTSTHERTGSDVSDKKEEHGQEDQTEIVAYLSSKFPLFPKLVRLHLEHNDLSIQSLSTIAKILPFCKNLGYFSILGNKLDLTTMTMFLQAVKNSKTLITLDCDLEGFPLVIKERLGLYSMRNMERLLYSLGKLPDGQSIEPLSQAHAENAKIGDTQESLTEQLNKILALKAQEEIGVDHPIVSEFVKRAMNIKSLLRLTIDELLQLQLRQELNIDGKETLIRFVFLESSINKGLQMIDPSLVDEQSGAMKLMGLSEDENNKYFVDEVQRNADDIQDPTKPQGASLAELSVAKSPVNMSRTSSRTSLNHLDKEEGSMMKLLTLLKFHDLHKSEPTISGEEIRKKLRNVNLAELDEVIKYLSDLKGKGITVKNVFNMNSDEADSGIQVSQASDAIDFDKIKRKLKQLAESKADEDNNSDSSKTDDKASETADQESKETLESDDHGQKTDSTQTLVPGLARVSSPEYGQRLDKLYDQVVKDYTKLDTKGD